MDDVIDDIVRLAKRCERAAQRFNQEPMRGVNEALVQAIRLVESAWGGSWLGYQANVYTFDLHARYPGEYFDTQYGQPVRGKWAEFSYEGIVEQILERAKLNRSESDQIQVVAGEVEAIVQDTKDELLPLCDAVLSSVDDPRLRELADAIRKLPLRSMQADLLVSMMPRNPRLINDMRALQGGMQAPPHLGLECWLISQNSTAHYAGELAKQARYIARYLEKSMKMKGRTVAKLDGPIFIGHGHSVLWHNLRDFIRDRLQLPWEEFNREPQAGRTNKERLTELLDRCPFAFLIMTAEDEQKDGKHHARMNVIHEAGLFQGRYGFERRHYPFGGWLRAVFQFVWRWPYPISKRRYQTFLRRNSPCSRAGKDSLTWRKIHISFNVLKQFSKR